MGLIKFYQQKVFHWDELYHNWFIINNIFLIINHDDKTHFYTSTELFIHMIGIMYNILKIIMLHYGNIEPGKVGIINYFCR